MPQRLLNEDWSDYDDRKKRHVDASYFSSFAMRSDSFMTLFKRQN